MKCLTETEISQWLTNAGHDEQPEKTDSVKARPMQFRAPDTYGAIENFMQCFLAEVVAEGDVLIVVTDDEPSRESQIFISDALRLNNGENRHLREAPGYLIRANERDKAIALFALMTSFGWKSYLYGDHDQVTLYNWEGEIFDAWISSETMQANLSRIIRNFDLEVIEDTHSIDNSAG